MEPRPRPARPTTPPARPKLGIRPRRKSLSAPSSTSNAFARVAGTIAPCGCTTEPLGGLQYAFGYIENNSAPQNRLVLEPGSFLFPEKDGPYWPKDDAEWEQARDRAKLLHTRFAALGAGLVSGLGPTDVVSPDGVKPLSTFEMPRVSANVTLPAGTTAPAPHRVVELKDHGITWKVGITSVVDPSLPDASGLGTIADPVAAAKSAADAMKKDGAQFTVVLAQGHRAFGESLAAEGIDLVVVGIPEGPRARARRHPGQQGRWHLRPRARHPASDRHRTRRLCRSQGGQRPHHQRVGGSAPPSPS